MIKAGLAGLETGYTLISRFSTTLVFPVEDLGAPPDRGFGALGPSENTPNFLKRRYAAQKFFFPRGAREKKLARTRKNGFEPGSNPVSAPFGSICLPIFPVHRLVQLSSESF